MSLKKLSLKQQKFVQEYIKQNGNATQAALAAYDTNYDSAQVIASHNLDKPNIIEAIDRQLKKSKKLDSDEYISQKLEQAIDTGIGVKATNSDAIRAIDMLLKIRNSYPNNVKKSMKLNVVSDRSTQSIDALTKELKELNSNTTKLLGELAS
jgi:phage terminase small subunit